MIDNIASSVLLFYLLIIAISILFTDRIFIATLLCGLFSLIIASTYMFMGAVDVAMTEAIVGGGVSTVFFINAINHVDENIKKKQKTFHLMASILIMMCTCIALLFSIIDMPAYGDINNPVNNHIYKYYIKTARDDFGFSDVVTAILASIRGYDTMGETTVVMLAAMSSMLIMRLGDEKNKT